MAKDKNEGGFGDFFTDKDYTIPESSNFFKFKEGDNTFRVLSSAVTGYEYWTTDNKVVRSKTEFIGTPSDIKIDKEGKSKINHFWAFMIYNYACKKIQLMTITQKGIQKYLKGLIENPKWGSPKGYDITINKTGSGFDTEYTPTAEPHSAMNPEVLEQYSKMNIDLDAIYEGGEVIKG